MRMAPTSVRLSPQLSGPRLDQFGAPGQPRVRPPHREIGAGFIEKDQAAGIYASDPPAEGAPLRLDARTILFDRLRSYCLKTYPVRCNARKLLDRWTRDGRSTAALYARVTSSLVRSGRSLTNRCNTVRSTGERQPAPAVEGRHVSPFSGALDPAKQGVDMHVEAAGHVAIRLGGRFVCAYGSRAERDRIRIRHARNRSQLITHSSEFWV